jgi:hypothetical protein
MATRTTLLVGAILILSGCWNGGNTQISLGSVSIGQQMMDLKVALEAGAMSQAEYDETRATLLSITSICQATDEEE